MSAVFGVHDDSLLLPTSTVACVHAVVGIPAFSDALLFAGVPVVANKISWDPAGFSLIKKEFIQLYAPSN
jgi:hypothetical protein